MGFVRRVVRTVTGERAEDVAREATRTQISAAERAQQERREAAARTQAFFEPFAGISERGVEASAFLADPEAQFEFLQQNPLFEAALANVNRQTQQRAAARSRLLAGDTLEQLGQNVLLASTPLIERQRQDIGTLLNLGTGVAGRQAAIESGLGESIAQSLEQIGQTQAAGDIAAEQARAQGIQNILNIIGSAIGGAVGGPAGAQAGAAAAPRVTQPQQIQPGFGSAVPAQPFGQITPFGGRA